MEGPRLRGGAAAASSHFCLGDHGGRLRAKRLWAFWCGAVPSSSLGHYDAINVGPGGGPGDRVRGQEINPN